MTARGRCNQRPGLTRGCVTKHLDGELRVTLFSRGGLGGSGGSEPAFLLQEPFCQPSEAFPCRFWFRSQHPSAEEPCFLLSPGCPPRALEWFHVLLSPSLTSVLLCAFTCTPTSLRHPSTVALSVVWLCEYDPAMINITHINIRGRFWRAGTTWCLLCLSHLCPP